MTRLSLSKLSLYAGLPIAIVMSSAMIARAFDTSWIAPNQPVSSSQLKSDLDEVQSRLAALENPDCPPGYTVSAKPLIASNPDSVQCKDGTDVVVRVGHGASAFWIDQYEASLWTTPTGGTEVGIDGGALPAGFPLSGQWTTPIYALSVAGVTPGTASWFQANEACRLSGKRLATGDEWLAAASGTPDPGNNANAPACNTSSAVTRSTGLSVNGCASRWGAEDMIGNIAEWTSEWFAGAGDGSGAEDGLVQNWPSGFGADMTVNQHTFVVSTGSTTVRGLPAAPLRGGSNNNGVLAGVFAMDLQAAPSFQAGFTGVRCAIK